MLASRTTGGYGGVAPARELRRHEAPRSRGRPRTAPRDGREARVWMSTRPPLGPRPARPATWLSSWKQRSDARKSGRLIPTSASITPTSVTFAKVEPLGDHLRAEQDVHLAAPHAVENVGVRPLPARGVDIHARDPRGREALGQQSLDLLRAEAAPAQRRPADTARQTACGCLVMLAVVADQPLGRAMIGQRDGAVRAGRDVTARLALHERRVAAPVEQEDALLAARERLAQRRSRAAR